MNVFISSSGKSILYVLQFSLVFHIFNKLKIIVSCMFHGGSQSHVSWTVSVVAILMVEINSADNLWPRFDNLFIHVFYSKLPQTPYKVSYGIKTKIICLTTFTCNVPLHHYLSNWWPNHSCTTRMTIIIKMFTRYEITC